MRKNKKEEKIRRNKPKILEIYTILIILSTLFMSVGFARISDVEFNILGKITATMQDGVFISNVSVAEESGVNANEIIYYEATTLSTSVELSTDNNAHITYKIELYNNSKSDYYFKGVAYDEEYGYSNKNIEYNLGAVEEYNLEALEEYKTVIHAKETKQIGLTFKHKTGITVSETQILNSLLNLEFSNEYIEITILETKYTVPKGATWEQYIASEYNTAGFKITEGKVYNSSDKQLLYTDTTNNIIGEEVKAEDVISEELQYIPEPTIILDKEEISLNILTVSATETLTATTENPNLELTWKVEPEDSGITISETGNTRTITASKEVENAIITVSYGKVSKTCKVTAIRVLKEGYTVKYDSNNDGVKEDWIVLTSQDGLLEIVSAAPMGSLTLGSGDTSVSVTTDLDGDGTVGNDADIAIASYNNAITTINDYCKSLVTATDNEGVRSVGGTDNSYTAYHSTNYDEWGKNITVDVAAEDEYYKTDFEKIEELGIASANESYWMASRSVNEIENYVDFCVRDDNLSSLILWTVNDDRGAHVYTPIDRAVRPVIINPYGIVYEGNSSGGDVEDTDLDLMQRYVLGPQKTGRSVLEVANLDMQTAQITSFIDDPESITDASSKITIVKNVYVTDEPSIVAALVQYNNRVYKVKVNGITYSTVSVELIDTDLDLMQRYVLGPEKTGRSVLEVANLDMQTAQITSFIDDPESITDASSKITIVKNVYVTDEPGIVAALVQYNNKVYEVKVNGTTYFTVSVELLTDTDLDLMQRYVLGPQKTGRLALEIANIDMETMQIISFIDDPESITDASSKITVENMSSAGNYAVVLVRYNNKLYEITVDGNTFFTVSVETTTGKVGREGQTVQYDSNNDGTKEDWIILTDRDGLVEIVSAAPMGSLTLGRNDTSVNVTIDIDKDGTVGDEDDIAIASYNNAITTINDYCKSLVTATDNEGVRSIGGTDNSYTAYHSTNYDELASNIAVDVAAPDTQYIVDYQRMQLLGILNTVEVYWMASRDVIEDSYWIDFHIRVCYFGYLISDCALFRVDGNGAYAFADESFAVRPVIINPSGI